MKFNRTVFLGIFIIVALIAVSIIFLLIEESGPPPATPLGSVEVTEYEGKPLSSVSDVINNAIHGVQDIDSGAYRLAVDGLVTRPASYTYDQVTNGFASYEKVVRLTCVEGWSANILWQGVLIKDILARAGVKPEAKVVIFHASDNYTTSFPIEYLTDNNILLAYGMNDITMPKSSGFPFQVVAESKYGYKWIKWVTEIEASDNTSYRGYWESLGFPNEGDINPLINTGP